MKITIPAAIRMHEILTEAEAKIMQETGIAIHLKVSQADITMSISAIAVAVSEALQVPVSELLDRSRKETIADARQIAMYLCHKYLQGISPGHIARSFNRDRTTLLHALKAVADMQATNDVVFLKKLEIAEKAVNVLINETKNNTYTA